MLAMIFRALSKTSSTIKQTIPRKRSQENQKRSANMGKVYVELSMSLDGFIAGPNDGPELPLGEGGERLFTWYGSGDTDFPLPGTDMVFKISRASADLLQEDWNQIGAMVTGRRTFDIAGAWGGNPPYGWTSFIVTHNPPQAWVKAGSPFTFVTDGIANALAQAKQAAAAKNVVVGGTTIVKQCLEAGLLDEIHIELAHMLLGDGIRLFGPLGIAPIELERLHTVEGTGVTHIGFRVVK